MDLRAKKGTRVHLDVLGRRVLLVPVGLLVPMVQEENKGVLALLGLLVLLVVLVKRESVLKGSKVKVDSLEYEDPKVRQAVRAPLALQVLVLKETRDTKEQQVNQDHLVASVILARKGHRVKAEPQADLETKAPWEKLVSQGP